MIFEVLFIIINVMRLGVPAISGVLAVSTVGEFIASILGIVVLVYAAVSWCIGIIMVCILGMACMYASQSIVSSAFLAPAFGMYLPTNGLFTLACQIIKGLWLIMTNVMWIIIFQAAGALAVRVEGEIMKRLLYWLYLLVKRQLKNPVVSWCLLQCLLQR